MSDAEDEEAPATTAAPAELLPAEASPDDGVGGAQEMSLEERALIQANRIRGMGSRAWEQSGISRGECHRVWSEQPRQMGDQLNRLPHAIE
eukprot:7459395-Pyramimonas_sp.AAC.1